MLTHEQLKTEGWVYIPNPKENFKNKLKGLYIRKLLSFDLSGPAIEIHDPTDESLGDMTTYSYLRDMDEEFDQLVNGEKTINEVFGYIDEEENEISGSPIEQEVSPREDK